MRGGGRQKKTPPERGFLLPEGVDYTPTMLEACLPFGPCVTSNWTF